jgi:hypothetical protein
MRRQEPKNIEQGTLNDEGADRFGSPGDFLKREDASLSSTFFASTIARSMPSTAASTYAENGRAVSSLTGMAGEFHTIRDATNLQRVRRQNRSPHRTTAMDVVAFRES